MKTLCFSACLFLMTDVFAADALISLKDRIFEVDLAVSAAERKRGLMQRSSLAPNQGMLFVYPEPQFVSFWMKQTLIPLDILFFDAEGRLIHMFEHVQPCRITPCKTYANKQPAQYVLELPAGSAERLSLRLGNRFEIMEP